MTSARRYATHPKSALSWGTPSRDAQQTMPGSNVKIVPGSHDGFNSVGAAATRDKKLPRSLARCRLRYHQCLTGRIKTGLADSGLAPTLLNQARDFGKRCRDRQTQAVRRSVIGPFR